MYHAHWGLEESPFGSRLDPRFFHESPTHEEALARLHFLVDQGRRLGLLTGLPGSGKSMLLEVFAGEVRREGRPVAKVNLLGIETEELLAEVAARLGVYPGPARDRLPLWRTVVDRLAELRYQQTDAVILFDSTDQAPPDVLTAVARLAQADLSPSSRLTLVLACRPDRVERLGQTLLEMAALRIDLQPWEQADTHAYLNHSLDKAGCRTSVFEEEAVGRIHELARGVPRRVSQLADLALAAGAGGRLESIDAGTVDSVYRELGVIEV